MKYREEMLRTANATTLNQEQQFTIGALGLTGESGEVADLIKKHLFHGAPLHRDKLIKELGDVRWYLELLCYATGVTLEEVEIKNVEKLRLRFPNGFNSEDAAAKKDEK